MTSKRKRREHLYSVVLGLEKRLSELLACEPRRRSEFDPVPSVPAIYLLSEGKRALYVGRTDDLKARLGGHMRLGNDRNSASFAFLLAKEDAGSEGLNIERTGSVLEGDDEFQPFFRAAKQRVARMRVRYVEIESPIEQSLLEVYVAESLATPYNSFENH